MKWRRLSLIRYGQMTSDELFVTPEAAANGVVVTNKSDTENLVMLKHFGPGNPQPHFRGRNEALRCLGRDGVPAGRLRRDRDCPPNPLPKRPKPSSIFTSTLPQPAQSTARSFFKAAKPARTIVSMEAEQGCQQAHAGKPVYDDSVLMGPKAGSPTRSSTSRRAWKTRSSSRPRKAW